MMIKKISITIGILILTIFIVIYYILPSGIYRKLYMPSQVTKIVHKYESVNTFSEKCPYKDFIFVAIAYADHEKYTKCIKWINKSKQCMLSHVKANNQVDYFYQSISATRLCNKNFREYLKERKKIESNH